MAPDERKRPSALKLSPSRSSSSGSSTESLKHPRTPRFAEATSIHSPVEGEGFFADPEKGFKPQAQPGDIGFGYINNGSHDDAVGVPMTPRSPLKSAMKVPGTPARRFDNPLSPTFREEQILEKTEAANDKEQARDLKIKTRVRMAKFALRGVNFSCSLIVLSMLSASFSIFNATRSLPAESNFPPWATNTKSWPQKVVLGAACVSLAISIGVFIGYCRGGHRRAEKVSVYYTLFAVGWFIVSMAMWAVAAGVLQFSRNNSSNQDMWGWSCVQNKRADLFSEKVDYALVCRLQNWSLICIIIEIVVEVISITLYSVIFYRYYSKRKLHKSMDLRDKARSDLYLAQLRSQSAPNTQDEQRGVCGVAQHIKHTAAAGRELPAARARGTGRGPVRRRPHSGCVRRRCRAVTFSFSSLFTSYFLSLFIYSSSLLYLFSARSVQQPVLGYIPFGVLFLLSFAFFVFFFIAFSTARGHV